MATSSKKYFWLKLKDDFFRQKEMKKLRKIAGGDTFTIIYLKLMLLSMKNEGALEFSGIEDTFAEELALEIDEDTDNVSVTLSFLQKCGLLEVLNEDEMLLTKVPEMTGKESDSAERVRRLRDKKKIQALQCNTDVTNCNTEIEIDIEKEIDISSIEFSEFVKEYKKIVSNATGVSENIVDQNIFNNLMNLKKYDCQLLLKKIKESDFLMGKLERKPNVANFSRKTMIDRIMADEYKNKEEIKQEAKSPTRKKLS